MKPGTFCVRVDRNVVGWCFTLALLLLPSLAQSNDNSANDTSAGLPWLPCSAGDQVESPRHEVLDLLNNRKLAFIGDSLTRYQYLELAYYIVHGRCQDPANPGDNGFILNLYTYNGISDFHKRSPKAITKDTEHVYAKEFLFGSRVSMQHGYTKEDRSFVYTDSKGRFIEMVYLQYFHELYGRLAQRLVAAENLKPTDLFINFGVWFVLPEPRNTTCGDSDFDETSKCPYMPSLCKYFEADHDFYLYWMASSPSRDTKESTDLNYNIGDGHNLNPITRCDMGKVGVVDREGMIAMLEPDMDKRYELFYDNHHFNTAEPYHAMNWDLINEVRKKVGSTAASSGIQD